MLRLPLFLLLCRLALLSLCYMASGRNTVEVLQNPLALGTCALLQQAAATSSQKLPGNPTATATPGSSS
jgi:hypothetical protein